VKRQVFSKKK